MSKNFNNQQNLKCKNCVNNKNDMIDFNKNMTKNNQYSKQNIENLAIKQQQEFSDLKLSTKNNKPEITANNYDCNNNKNNNKKDSNWQVSDIDQKKESFFDFKQFFNRMKIIASLKD
jgi:hypothetical protein